MNYLETAKRTLADLFGVSGEEDADQADTTRSPQVTLYRPEAATLIPPDPMAHEKTDDIPGVDEESSGPDGWPVDCVDPNELTPCAKCGTLEMWQSVAGDLFGLTPGRWRCTKCDPPTAARRLTEAAERIRQRANLDRNTRQKG